MILLDYWPLKRFEFREGNFVLWQLKEKIPLFILSAVFSLITIYTQYNPSIKHFPFSLRIANASVSFITYLEKTLWPRDLAVFYPYPAQLPLGQVLGATLLILVISAWVIGVAKRLPYLFVGWLWYAITLLPVIGIVQSGEQAMANRYHYLPSIGIAVMLAWGIPLFFTHENLRKIILFPAGVFFISILSLMTWQQCGHWQNSIKLCNYNLQVTKNNYLAHNNLGIALSDEGKNEEAMDHFNRGDPSETGFFHAYNNKGNVYVKQGRYQSAIEDFNEAIRLKPDFADGYHNLGIIHIKLGLYQNALDYFSKAIRLRPDDSSYYSDRGIAYANLGQYRLAIDDYNLAIRLKPDYADAYNNRGGAYFKLGQYQSAVKDFNEAIRLKPDYADAYNNRGGAFFNLGNQKPGCYDAQKACKMGNCIALLWAKKRNYCH